MSVQRNTDRLAPNHAGVLPERRGLAKKRQSDHRQVVTRMREEVRRQLPRDATVLVVSQSDPALLRLGGRTGWHFPRDPDGKPAACPLSGGLGAIAHLEALRAAGAQYLLVPRDAFSWLGQSGTFRQHLEQQFRQMSGSADTCLLYSLHEAAGPGSTDALGPIRSVVAEFEARFERQPAILDWHSRLELARTFPQLTIFVPPERGGLLPYLDRSVDIVVTTSGDERSAREARRAAIAAVVTAAAAGNGANPPVAVQWLPGCPRRRLSSASIIIPCHDGRSLTDACLGSLRATLPQHFRGEIIVVDDASTDDTSASLNEWGAKEPRMRILRSRRNLGFVDSCNRGARLATGEILIFLNNDVVLLPGWLPPLLRTFRSFPEAGAVGGKLILPDGTLQEAGGVVFRDGSAMNFGRGDQDVEAPLYNFVREADYCSGALLATRRVLFKELGGFDAAFRPGYYEDTDYCFRLREHGYRTLYQPECAVVHREGGTAGADLSNGMKRYQVTNREKFASRWRNALQHQPAKPREVDQAVRYELGTGRTARLAEGTS